MAGQITMTQDEFRELAYGRGGKSRSKPKETRAAIEPIKSPHEAGKLLIAINLPINLENDNNGQGHGWSRTSKRRNQIESEIRAAGHVRAPFEFKVRLVVMRVLGKRQKLWDDDSVLRGSAKQLIDSLVACGWFVDDKPKWLKVDQAQWVPQIREKPSVTIQVFSL